MSRIINMVGYTCGKLTVIEKAQSNKHGEAMWKCHCKCGNETIVRGSDLRNQHIKSCGCLQQATDITDQIFGYLTVLSKSDKTDSSRRTYWNCLCKCGNITTVTGAHLRSGNTKSCGCLISKGNLKIGELLRANNIEYIAEKFFSDLQGKQGRYLRFDFFIPQLNTVIEYQGVQHYKPIDHFGGNIALQQQQEYDELKRKYCLNNNIKYIEIPYQDYSNLTWDYLQEKLN